MERIIVASYIQKFPSVRNARPMSRNSEINIFLALIYFEVDGSCPIEKHTKGETGRMTSCFMKVRSLVVI